MAQPPEKTTQIKNRFIPDLRVFACIRMLIALISIFQTMHLLVYKGIFNQSWLFYLSVPFALIVAIFVFIGYLQKILLPLAIMLFSLIDFQHRSDHGIFFAFDLLILYLFALLPLSQTWSIDRAFQHQRERETTRVLPMFLVYFYLLVSGILFVFLSHPPSSYLYALITRLISSIYLDWIEQRYTTWLKKFNQIESDTLHHHHEVCIGKSCDLFEKCSEAKACVNDHHIFPIEYHKEHCENNEDLIELSKATNHAFEKN
jgi:hypothetical protein